MVHLSWALISGCKWVACLVDGWAPGLVYSGHTGIAPVRRGEPGPPNISGWRQFCQ